MAGLTDSSFSRTVLRDWLALRAVVISAFAFGEGILEGDPADLRISHDAIRRLPVIHNVTVMRCIADAELSSGHEVSGESGGRPEHAHGEWSPVAAILFPP